MKQNVVIDRDVPDVIEGLEKQGAWATAMTDPVAELQKFEAAGELQGKLLPASIRRTLPEDWIDQGGKAYLQSTGVERLTGLWGLVFGEPHIERENHDDGSYSYVVTGPIGCRRTGVLYKSVLGGRSSSDPFFDEFDEEKPRNWKELTPGQRATWRKQHRIEPDPLEVKKAAVTNWTTRGASMLMGMRGLTTAYLESLGIVGIRRVEYGTGARGGDATPADLKAERTKFGNEVLAAAGGDKDAARTLLKEVTAGKDFAGFDSVEGIRYQWQIDNGRKKLEAHPLFGKRRQREPGEEP
jgi:hypothetical protein